MTKAQSTSKPGVSRNRKRLLARSIEEWSVRAAKSAVEGGSGARRHVAGRGGAANALDAVLTRGRERLASAESVLACLHLALLYADDRSVQDSPDYANAVALAIGMLREARDQVDEASLRPLLEAHSGPVLSRRTKQR